MKIQHRVRWWLGAWWHQAITWTNVSNLFSHHEQMSQIILRLLPDNYKFILTMLCCLCKTLTFQWSWHSFSLQTSWMKIDHPNRKPLHSGPCVLVMSKKWIMSSCARTTPLHGRHGSLTTRHGPWMLTITPTKLLLAKGHAMVFTRYAQFL